MKEIFLAFIPVFVAVDAIGTLPIFASLTEELTPQERIKIIIQSMITALCLAVGFIFLGKFVFKLLNITIGDFMIAGGALLFCIAIIDLLNPAKQHRIPAKELGVVPLGTPLLVGPAVLTTSIIIIDEYGLQATLVAVLANILLAGCIFLSCNLWMKLFGEGGSRALSKVMSLLLAAIAVMMMRKGVTLILAL